MARRTAGILALTLVLAVLHPEASAEETKGFPPREGLVLRDGTVVSGVVDVLEDGRFRVTPEGGTGAEYERDRVAVALRGDKVVHRDGEGPVHRAWRRHLAPEVVKTYEAHYKLYNRARLYSDALKVMEKATAWGFPKERLEALRKKLAKRKDRDRAERKRETLAPKLAEAREPMITAFRDAATWCSDRGLLRAASALLGEAMRLTPDTESLLAQTASLIPAGFPGREDPEAARRWLHWASVLPVQAAWVPPSSPIRASLTKAPWNLPDTLVLRTRNLLLLSRVDDPEVIATCLRRGEEAVQAVEALLDHRHRARKGAGWDHLEIRLYPDRAECDKAAKAPSRGHSPAPPPSAAGCYAPGQRASLFFVPEEGGLGALSESVAHVLTHHYLAVRWRTAERRSRYSITSPGFWCVEGIAGFIADQAGGEGLDDVETRSLEIAAAAARKKALLPLPQLLGLSQWELQSLSKVPFLGVEGSSVRLNRIEIFYAQAAALTFFLVHRRGAEGRKQYVETLLDFYRGKITREGWRNLGYKGIEPLEQEFAKFLASLK